MPNSRDGESADVLASYDEGDYMHASRQFESMGDITFIDYLKRNGVEISAEGGKLKLSASRGFLTAELQDELRRRKQRLLEHLSMNGLARGTGSSPLSYAQERLWLLSRFDSKEATYNIPQAWWLDGEVDERALRTAIQELVRRHTGLSSRIAWREGRAEQVALEEPNVSLQVVDIQANAAERNISERVLLLCVQEGRKPFDLEVGPLIRFVLINISDELHVLFMCVHHIVADQHSLNLLKRDLRELYKSVLANTQPELPTLELNYYDIAQEERAYAKSTYYSEQLDYWRERLNAAPSLLELPFSKGRPARISDEGERYIELIDHGITIGLRKLAADASASLYTLMLSIFVILLYRYTGEADLCIGTPKSTRKRSGQADMVGLFLNMLPIRCTIDPNETILQMVGRFQDTVLNDFECGDVPFQMIVDTLKPERSESYSPLFQIMFSLNPRGIAAEERELEIDLGIAKYDLSLQVSEKQYALEAHFEFRTQLFGRLEMQQFARHLHRLAQSVVESPMMPVGQLPMLREQDFNAIAGFNHTELPTGGSETIISLFEQQAMAIPDAVALLTDKGSYTYRLIDERAEEAANKLREAGVEPGTLVGVCLGRSGELIVALLGIFKVGAAYLPLDPKYPAERIWYMLSDSGARYVIVDGTLLSSDIKVRLPGLSLFWADELLRPVAGEMSSSSKRDELARRDSRQVPKPEDMAYVIYTSGSTGAPKGTVVEHRNVVALLAWANSFFDLESKRYVVASTSVCFDLSVFELFFPLCTGNAVVLLDSILDLSKSQYRQRATLINTVPSAMRALLAKSLPSSVRTVCLAGELLPTELVDRIYEAGVEQVFDLYGPTETTTYSTCGLRLAGAAPHIGRPIGNTRIYLLDESLQQVPVGAIGEIVIGGAGVTRGYLNREELTREKFVSIPSLEATSRLYRTGDLAVQSSHGSLIYKGRRDHQIKLRGHRIELGEIESVLSNISNGSQVAVVVTDQGGGAMLSAFIEGTSTGLADDDMRRKLKANLPEFMVPAHITCLDQLPRTPSGKIDRAALMRYGIAGQIASKEYPATLLEQALANIFSVKLNLSEVDRNAHFFDELGGNSLAAFEIFVEIENRLQVSTTPNMLFQGPTVKLLAMAIDGHAWHRPQRIGFVRAGSSEEVVYRVWSNSIDHEYFAVYDRRRIMSVEIVSEADIRAAVAEIVLFEVNKPEIIVSGSQSTGSLLGEFARSLNAAGFGIVEDAMIPPSAT